jgi:hypothetical protein
MTKTTTTHAERNRIVLFGGSLALLLILAWLGKRYVTKNNTNSKVINKVTLFKTLLQEMQSEEPRQQPIFVLEDPSTLTMDDKDDEYDAIVEATVQKACNEFHPKDQQVGRAAWEFLRRLSTSSTFVKQYWHQRPLLLRAKDIAAITSTTCSNSNESSTSWVAGAFTEEQHLR